MLGKIIFDICWLTWGAERARTLCGRSCKQKLSFHEKVTPRAHCGVLLASAGQLVAPWGLLFDFLFVTLGRYWGPPGPKLQKDVKIDEKWRPKGRLFRSFVIWRTVKVMLFFGPFSLTILDGFWSFLGRQMSSKCSK